MSLRNHPFVIFLCISMVSAYLAMALFLPKIYILATYEDLAGEWLQFWLFVTATLFFTRLVFAPTPFRWFFALLALGCFYVSMEEISWGQRIFNVATPEFFQKHNIQKEINLHNLVAGPMATLSKRIITYGLSFGIFLYGVIYPLAVRWGWPVTRPLLKRGIAPPPLFLWPLFICGAFLELGLFRFNETEVAEMLIATALAIMGLYYYRLSRYDRKLKSLAARQRAGVVKIAASTGLLLFLTSALALGMTAQSYTSEHNRARIDNRLQNGIEKFANRYKCYGQWETAAELYLHIHYREPLRNSILRKLADCYRRMGDEDRSQFYNDKALANDLARYQKDPDSIALNQSLARTYRQRNQPAKARFHTQRALELAKAWVRSKPQSAKAAYWLGKTYLLMDKDDAAMEQYLRACRLDPVTLKYRKAYIRVANRKT